MANLTNEEKLSIIEQHVKNLQFSQYNAELSLLEENALTSPDTEAISSLTKQMSDLGKKISALNSEADSLKE